MLSWAGVMRIGEVLAATRKELVLLVDCVPDTSFALIMIRSPKTRGRAARHQAARIDQEDIIRFLTAMYAESPKDTKIRLYSAATLRKRDVLVNTGRRWSWLRSGREHWAMDAAEVRHGTLGDGRG